MFSQSIYKRWICFKFFSLRPCLIEYRAMSSVLFLPSLLVFYQNHVWNTFMNAFLSSWADNLVCFKGFLPVFFNAVTAWLFDITHFLTLRIAYFQSQHSLMETIVTTFVDDADCQYYTCRDGRFVEEYMQMSHVHTTALLRERPFFC